MNINTRAFSVLAIATLASGALFAQSGFDKLTNFSVDGVKVQMHGFASQGFAFSNDNNFLTMKTTDGSFAFTDGGINLAATITDKFRIAAQAYVSNVGKLGRGHVSFDWGYADYKFKDWFGLRGGKVKTALGLFNDTQDMEFLNTWALLPQGVYPVDLRSSVIAHTGGDVYGEVSLHKAGSVSYTGYAGIREDDRFGGLYYGDAGARLPIRSFAGITKGVDVRWHTPLEGLMIGGSFADQTQNVDISVLAAGGLDLLLHSQPQHVTAGYGDFARGKWHFNGEFRRDHNFEVYTFLGRPGGIDQSAKAWFLTAAYRINKRLEIGTYQSRFYSDNPQVHTPVSSHIIDQTVTARFDITPWWDFKVEEHFINGFGDLYSAHGFYPIDNPSGLKPTTDLFVVRTGVNF